MSQAVSVCGSEACAPVPVSERPPADFLWQVNPFQLSGGGVGYCTGRDIVGERSVARSGLAELDFLFMENVGNLLCPSNPGPAEGPVSSALRSDASHEKG
jgi:hypothetical protein